MSELLPCPFCGGEVKLFKDNRDKCGAYCKECEATVGVHLDKVWRAKLLNRDEAIAAWNRRAILDSCGDAPDTNVGEWERMESTGGLLGICSACKYPVSWWYKSRFCPSCGAKMEDKHMKLIYIAHPFGGEQENADAVEKIVKGLMHKHPDCTFYSPLHATGFMYSQLTYLGGMEHCFEALSRCDELWLCGSWQESRGCNMEYGFAKGKGIPITEITG